MRWTQLKLKEGDLRTKRRFLWWPTTIRGETRWWEWATIEYKWVYDFFGRLSSVREWAWEKIRFIDASYGEKEE